MCCQLLSIFFIISIISFSMLLLMKKENKAAKARRLPPGPRKLPFIGNLHLLKDLPHRSLQHLSNEYGDLMLLQLGSIPALIVSSADIAREIFRIHDRAFSGRPALYVAKKFTYNCCNVSFAPYGEYWREVRKIVVLELLSLRRVISFEAIREEEVKFMVDSIAHGSSNPINLSELTLLLANNVVCRTAFGEGHDEGINGGKSKFQEILHETQDLLGGLNIADYFPWMAWLNKFNGLEARVDKNFREMSNYFDKVIEEHLNPERPKSTNEDFIDVLLRIQKDPNQTSTFSNEHIKAILVDIFVAGSDTSSATLVWTMAELIKNPLKMRRAQEELREVVKQKGKVEENDLPKLVYLKSVIKEALRLHPPVPLLVPRETIEGCTLGGYEIPAKTRVFINATSIAKDPKYWEYPHEFKPERFLDNLIDFGGQHCGFLPFGAGRRGCPGINFAFLLIELTLANLLYRFDWTLPKDMKLEQIDMEEAQGLTAHKKTPLFLVASPANA